MKIKFSQESEENGLKDMILDSLEKIKKEEEHEREVKLAPVYNAVCIKCGEVIAVNKDHSLYKKCEDRKYIDALPVNGCKNCEE